MVNKQQKHRHTYAISTIIIGILLCMFLSNRNVKEIFANSTAAEFVAVAQAEIGTQGPEDQRNKYTLWRGAINGYPDEGYGYPWCATFVSWCMNEVGGFGEEVYPSASCNVMWANSKGVKHTDTTSYIPQPGDIIFYDYGSTNSTSALDHVGIVESYDAQAGIVYTIEGNYSNAVSRVERPYLSNDICGYITPTFEQNNIPVGAVTSVSVSGDSIKVKGWAIDKDTPQQSVTIHVYIGGNYDNGGVGHVVLADKLDRTIGNAYEMGNYHGINHSFTVTKYGIQDVYVYAIDTENPNMNIFLGKYTVDVAADTTAPMITDVRISNVTKDGYLVSCIVTDNRNVDRVQFPTWTDEGGQDDLATEWWNNELVRGKASTPYYSFYVNTSEHNGEGGYYNTHIYAYDRAGNCASIPLSKVYVDNLAPVIGDAYVIVVDEYGYTVRCKVSDDTGVASVHFPTFIKKSEDDTLADNWEETNSFYGEIDEDGYYYYRINREDFGWEYGDYITKIIARDDNGNQSEYTFDVVKLIKKDVICIFDKEEIEIDLTVNDTEDLVITATENTPASYYFTCGYDKTDLSISWGSRVNNVSTVHIQGLKTGTHLLRVSMYDKVTKEKVFVRDFTVSVKQTISIEGMNASLSYTRAIYCGKSRKPSVTLIGSNGALKKGRDFLVTYQNFTNVGVATAIVTGIGKYSGEIILNYDIAPIKQVIKEVKKASAKIRVYFTPDPQATGYQIRYSQKEDFSSFRAVTVTGAKRYYGDIIDYKLLKTYYFQVRTFRQDGERVIYGNWSDTVAYTVR